MIFKEAIKKYLFEEMDPITEKLSKVFIDKEEEEGDEWNKETQQVVKRIIRQLGRGDIRGTNKLIQGVILKGSKVYDEDFVDEFLPKIWRKLKSEEKKRNKR